MSLETQFIDAIEDLDLPDLDVSAAVLNEIPAAVPTRGTSTGWLLRAAAIVVLACAALIVIVEPARTAVARWLGIGATNIEIDPNVRPDAAPPPNTVVGAETDSAVWNPIPLLGQPISVSTAGTGTTTYSWAAGDGWVSFTDDGVGVSLSVRPVTGAPSLKIASGEGDVHPVEIVTEPSTTLGLWVGADHLLVSEPDAPAVRAARVLLWEQEGRQFRLESNGDLDDVVALAESIDIARLVAVLEGTD